MLVSVLFLVTVNSLVNLPFLNCLEILEIKPHGCKTSTPPLTLRPQLASLYLIFLLLKLKRVWSECLYPSRTPAFKFLQKVVQQETFFQREIANTIEITAIVHDSKITSKALVFSICFCSLFSVSHSSRSHFIVIL